MARHALAAGLQVYVCDVDPAAYAQLVEEGASAAATLQDLAAKTQVIVTSLPGPSYVDVVMLGPAGLLSAATRGTLIIETSTIAPAQSRALARRFAENGVDFVDAPLSGGVAAAKTASLTAMVGGTKAQFERALPILRCFAPLVIHMGPSGAGSTTKLINQAVYLSYVATYCEAVAFGQQAGLDVLPLLDVLRNSVAGNPLVTGWDSHIETMDLKPGFPLGRVLKDLELSAEAYREQGYDSPLLDGVLRAFRDTANLGHAEDDMTALYATRAKSAGSGTYPSRSKKELKGAS